MPEKQAYSGVCRVEHEEINTASTSGQSKYESDL